MISGALASALMLAAPVALPAYQPGDAFVFSDGRVERVRGRRNERVIWSGLSGQPYQRSRNFIVPVLDWRSGRSTGRREVRGNPDALWPIDRPKSVRFRVVTETRATPQSASKRSVSLWVCKTSKPRPVIVAAGSFDAIPVVCDRYSTTTMRLVERREWDYAPEIGHYVKRSTLNYLRGTRTSLDLVATLSGPGATRARIKALSQDARRQFLAKAQTVRR